MNDRTPAYGPKPSLHSAAEELALECQLRARESAAHALELNRLANRFLELSRNQRTEVAVAVAS